MVKLEPTLDNDEVRKEETETVTVTGKKRKRVAEPPELPDARKKAKAKMVSSPECDSVKVDGDTGNYLRDTPANILYEICAYLHPTDLLRLSRTSKHLRSHLMNASARCAWRTAFELIGIREVREDLQEPRLANLLFERRCDKCTQRPEFPHLLLRARLCKPCFKSSTEFLSKPDLLKAVLKSVPSYNLARHVRLLQVTPYSGIASYLLYPVIAAYSEYSCEDYNYFDVKSHLQMVNETKEMKDEEFEQWYEQAAKNFSGLWDECKQLYDLLHSYKVEKEQRKEKKKARLREERRLEIRARLIKAGYHPERGTWDSTSWWCRPHLKCRRIFERAAKVTDEAWIKEDMLDIIVDAGGVISQEEHSRREALWRDLKNGREAKRLNGRAR